MHSQTGKNPERTEGTLNIPVIAGPTGSGKTSVTEMLTDSYEGRFFEIISLDSRQVYKGMPVGTAQPSVELQKRLKHHLTGFLSPADKLNANDYRKAALAAIEACIEAGNIPVVTGGTGFYLRALESAPFEAGVSDDIRSSVEGMSPAERLDRLTELRPDMILARGERPQKGKVHPNDTYRVSRALELALAGYSYSDLWKEKEQEWSGGAGKSGSTALAKYTFSGFRLETEKDIYWKNLEKRCRSMVKDGMPEEALVVEKQFGNCAGLQTIGYPDALRCAHGRISKDELAERLFIQHRQYGKRQRTWFSRQHPNLTGISVEKLRNCGPEGIAGLFARK